MKDSLFVPTLIVGLGVVSLIGATQTLAQGKPETPGRSAENTVCICHNLAANPHTVCVSQQGYDNGLVRHVESGFSSLGACETTPTPTPSPTPEPTPDVVAMAQSKKVKPLPSTLPSPTGKPVIVVPVDEPTLSATPTSEVTSESLLAMSNGKKVKPLPSTLPSPTGIPVIVVPLDPQPSASPTMIYEGPVETTTESTPTVWQQLMSAVGNLLGR